MHTDNFFLWFPWKYLSKINNQAEVSPLKKKKKKNQQQKKHTTRENINFGRNLIIT